MKSSNAKISLKGLNGRWWDGYKESIAKAMECRPQIYDDYETNVIRNILALEANCVELGETFAPSRKQFNFIRDMAEKAIR